MQTLTAILVRKIWFGLEDVSILEQRQENLSGT